MTQGQPPQAPKPDLGPFEPVRLLGKGGMGAVYLARDATLDRPTAVKTLLPQHASDENVVLRFMREARAAAKLNHPNICQVYSVGESSLGPYIAMEYVEGVSLDELIRTQGPIPWQRATVICGQAASALALAHKHGIIHRDIKPANLLIDAQGRCRVTDFGVAKVVEEAGQLTTQGVFIGTPQYMSPEQCGIGTVGPASDLFSLGVTFYEMLTGTLPFGAGTPAEVIRRVTQEPPPPIAGVMPGIPEPLQAVVMKLLEKDPRRRYPNAGALMADLNRLRTGQPLLTRGPRQAANEAPTVAVSRKETQGAPATRKRRGWTIWAAVAVLLILFAAGAAMLKNNRAAQPRATANAADVPADGSALPQGAAEDVGRAFTLAPGLDGYHLLPVGWARGRQVIYIAGFKPGGGRSGGEFRLAAADLVSGKSHLGPAIDLTQGAARMAREHIQFAVCHGPKGSPLENALLLLRPVIEVPRRLTQVVSRSLEPGSDDAEPVVRFTASLNQRSAGNPNVFQGECMLMAPKSDGRTLCLAVSPRHSRDAVLVERDLTAQPLGVVGPHLTPPGSPIVAAAYDPPGNRIVYARAAPSGNIEIWLASANRPDPRRNEMLWSEPGTDATLSFHREKPVFACAVSDAEGAAPKLFVCSLERFDSDNAFEVTEAGTAWISQNAWDKDGWLYLIEKSAEGWAALRYRNENMHTEELPLGRAPAHERVRPSDGVWVSPWAPWAVVRMPGNPPGELAAMRLNR